MEYIHPSPLLAHASRSDEPKSSPNCYQPDSRVRHSWWCSHVAIASKRFVGLLGDHEAVRFWLFASLVALMVMFSPIVWYHHSTLLLLPLVALIVGANRQDRVIGVSLLLVIQFERVFDYAVMHVALPVLVAHVGLSLAAIAIYLKHWRTASTDFVRPALRGS